MLVSIHINGLIHLNNWSFFWLKTIKYRRRKVHYLQDYVSDKTESSQERDFNSSIQLREILAAKNCKEGCQAKGRIIRSSAEPQHIQTGMITYKCKRNVEESQGAVSFRCKRTAWIETHNLNVLNVLGQVTWWPLISKRLDCNCWFNYSEKHNSLKTLEVNQNKQWFCPNSSARIQRDRY